MIPRNPPRNTSPESGKYSPLSIKKEKNREVKSEKTEKNQHTASVTKSTTRLIASVATSIPFSQLPKNSDKCKCNDNRAS